jgi:cell division septal protein FtsQ
MTIASAALLSYLWWSDDFYVVHPRVEGNQVIATSEILTIGQIQGHHIFTLDPRSIALAVSALPDVERVQVSYRLPHHVTIRVQEREAILTWVVGDQPFEVDASGTLLSPREQTTLAITIRDREHASGELLQVERVAERAEAVAAVRTYSTLLSPVSTYEYSTAEGLSVVLGEQRVILGDAQAAEAKIILLRALLERLAQRGVAGARIDLRYQTPYYRLSMGGG